MVDIQDLTLRTITTGGVDCLLWPAALADKRSSWIGHVSFAHWLVGAIAPRVVVELGTHIGISFVALCESAQRNKLATHCYAVDTWKGDAHAGFYGEDIYKNLNTFVQEHYPNRATLLRCFFDEALSKFQDGSIDLLHIDGLHTYEAVRHDYLTWLPKMSDRGVIIFHDTDIHAKDFGVWRFWEEISAQYPHFRFRHSAGLGVLAVGADIPPAIAELCATEGSAEGDRLRATFAKFSKIAKASHDEARQAEELRRAKARSRDELLKKLSGLGENIALNRPAFQSSAHPDTPGKPEAAVDGVKNGLFAFHTAFEPAPWWTVDLGEAKGFGDIIVYNRLDGPCAGRARSLRVLVSQDCEEWSEIYAHDGSYFGGADDSLPLHVKAPGTVARFVRLQPAEPNYLHLVQVEIYAPRTA